MADDIEKPEMPKGGGKKAKVARGALQAVGGAVPLVGGLVSAVAGAWSEHEQEQVNRFFDHWIRMLHDELKEKEETIIEIMARLDMQDEEVIKRVESPQYQSLLKKAFRDWSGAESNDKRVFIRNILTNAAQTSISSDDVIKMYLDWLEKYSLMHFQVIAAIYNQRGITRGGMWRSIGKGDVREDSADADLFKLLIRDLSTGGIIRQHRETDYYGNPIAKRPQRRPKGSGPKPAVSAFDDVEEYELTDLGKQFVHYAMTEQTVKIEFDQSD